MDLFISILYGSSWSSTFGLERFHPCPAVFLSLSLWSYSPGGWDCCRWHKYGTLMVAGTESDSPTRDNPRTCEVDASFRCMFPNICISFKAYVGQVGWHTDNMFWLPEVHGLNAGRMSIVTEFVFSDFQIPKRSTIDRKQFHRLMFWHFYPFVNHYIVLLYCLFLIHLNSVHLLLLIACVLHHALVLLSSMSAAENTENTRMLFLKIGKVWNFGHKILLVRVRFGEF